MADSTTPSASAGNNGRARGGHARAAQLSSSKRSEIAKKAAATRWDASVSETICGSPDKPLLIGDVEIECYVLADGTRVLTQSTFLAAMGRHPTIRHRPDSAEDEVGAPIIQGRTLTRFVSDELRAKSRPIPFRHPSGFRASGYNAEILPAVCEVYLKARDAGTLQPSQMHIAARADILIRGLAHVGIIALVDEATGYQEVRVKNALARILEDFIEKELRPWVQTFPADFYKELFRLRGLDYPNSPIKRPQYFGVLTNDIVYKRLGPGILAELRKVTARNESGRPKHKYFQHLTENIGYPKLREHLGSVVAIMKLSRDWSDFMLKLERIHPRVGDTIPLPFEEYGSDTGL
jgi:P63C domain.